MRLLAILTALGVLAINSTSAASASSLSVPLRSADSKDAEVVEEVQLYGASYALVIGIDEYTQGWPRLSNAVKDAKLVAAALEKQGFHVTLKLNLKSRELDRALEDFYLVKGEDPEARLFVWFAGHGHTERGEGFLIPSDAPNPSTGSKFRVKALSLRRIGEYVRLAESKHAFAVFDSCFSGTVFESSRALPPAAITRATTQPVRQFLTSGDAGQTVSDDGTFRELFLRVLNGEESADANKDGYVTATEVGLFLSDRVTNLTQSKQTPRYGKLRDKDFDRGDFVFRLASLPKPKQRTETRDRSAHDNRQQENLFWESIKDSLEAEAFDAYLAQFPNGTFAALAKVKRKVALRKRQEARLEKSRLNEEREQLAAERQQLAAKADAHRRAEAARLAEERANLKVQRAELEASKRRSQLASASPNREVATAPKPSEPVHLEPAPYRSLPKETVVNFNGVVSRVTESGKFKTELRSGSDIEVLHGGLVRAGEGIFSVEIYDFNPSSPPRLELSDSAQQKLMKIWPMQVGSSAEFEVEERITGNQFQQSENDTWQFNLKVIGIESVEVGGRHLSTFVIETRATSSLGRAFTQTQWYHPNGGLVVKSIRRWAGASVPQARRGMRPGDEETQFLQSVRFPKGAQNALVD